MNTVWFNNQYLKLRNLKLYFITRDISTFSDFKLFSTVLFATLKLKTRSEKSRGTGRGLVPDKSTGPKPVPAQIPPEQEFRSGPNRKYTIIANGYNVKCV